MLDKRGPAAETATSIIQGCSAEHRAGSVRAN